jgi:hypothetical protein
MKTYYIPLTTVHLFWVYLARTVTVSSILIDIKNNPTKKEGVIGVTS